ncbi:MAG: hypothetical protein LBV77_06975 [Candidatus Adiutrix intracellularis]|nr:hypothetical protein [Candidatus Adiutrix intracellularis]
MDDVLFNGSYNRPALALAGVILTLAWDSAPGPAESLAICCFYRSDDSKHLINKVPHHLKDVINFFTD